MVSSRRARASLFAKSTTLGLVGEVPCGAVSRLRPRSSTKSCIIALGGDTRMSLGKLVGNDPTTTPFFLTVRATGSQVGLPCAIQPEMSSRGGVTFGRLPDIRKFVYEPEISVFANGL